MAEPPQQQQQGGAAAAAGAAAPKKKKLLNGTNIEYRYPSGSVYVGGFKDGKLHGFGKYSYHPSGDIYEGEWLADMKHGHGVYTYDGGDCYTGEWRAGKKHGKGNYTFASGDEYVGHWLDDKIHGFGVFTIARNGNRYEGHWEESYRQGHGVLSSGNGDVYDGKWTRGKEDGLGVLHYANGNIYAGDWRAGQMDGKGIFGEKGQKHTVEHIAGYLIAKVPIDKDAVVDEAWLNADRLYREYQHRLAEKAAKELQEAGGLGGGGGAGGMGGGGPDGMDAKKAMKLEMDCAMWKKRYEDLVATTTSGLSAAGGAGEDNSIEGLKKRVAALTIALEAEKAKANEAASKAKLLESEITELKFQQNNGTADGAGGGGGGTSDAVLQRELDELRRKNGELQKELDTRKRAANEATGGASGAGGSSALPDDPLELKVRLELAEGELKNLREKREEVYKLREQQLDQMKTIQKLEVRNEELMKEINVHRARSANLQGQINETTSKQYQEVTAELATLRTDADEAKKAKLTAEENLSKARRSEQLANVRITELESENARLKLRSTNLDTDLGKNLDKKNDQLDSLRRQNADLQRQLEEALYDLKMVVEDPSYINTLKTRLGNKKGGAGAGGGGSGGAGGGSGGADAALQQQVNTLTAEVENLQGDVKKEKKKYKKAVAERDAIAQELYNEQILTTRLTRVLDNLRGRVTVFASIDNHTDPEGTGSETTLKINQDNPAEIIIVDPKASGGRAASPSAGGGDDDDEDGGGGKKGKKSKKDKKDKSGGKGGSQQQLIEFDACMDSSFSAENAFDELKPSLNLVANGFHVAFVTMGPMGGGKTHFTRRSLPLALQHLYASLQKQTTSGGLGATFSTTVKVGGLEATHGGVFDCVSGSEIMAVEMNTNNLLVTAVGQTFTEAKDAAAAVSLYEKFRTGDHRKIKSGRSHLFFHVVVEMKHKVLNISKTGRFTMADLCGHGALSDQETDVESARYASVSSKNIMDIVNGVIASHTAATAASASSNKNPTIPYDINNLTRLLFDVLGGNAITSIIACASATNKEVAAEGVVALRAASNAKEVCNRPVVPDVDTPDVARLRALVADAVDREKSLPASQAITNIRF